MSFELPKGAITFVSVSGQSVTVGRQRGFSAMENEITLVPCPDCRGVVFAEDMAEHRAREHDTYYPDPRADWQEYTVAACEVEDGDWILGDARVEQPVKIDWSKWGWDKREATVQIHCLYDGGFLEFEAEHLLRVLRRERDYH